MPQWLSCAEVRLGFQPATRGPLFQIIFRLFLASGAYLEYARQYLLPEQIDKVELSGYLGHA